MDQRNYTEDQANEIEALDSIYCGDMESMWLFILSISKLKFVGFKF